MKYFPVLLFFLLLSQGCSAQKKSQLIEGEMKTVNVQELGYYLYYPEDYETKSNEKFPLLLFLQGGGESGNTLNSLKTNGPPKMIAEGKQFPFLILAPQNPDKKKWWNTRAVVQLLDSIVAHNRVDPERIYLTGLSRGGGAAWELAVQYPKKFAALAVVCGMTPVPYASWIDETMPIWVFHGEEDPIIPIAESEAMVAKLRKMGHDVKFTRYPDVGHDSWIKAYQTQELYSWLLQQKRNN